MVRTRLIIAVLACVLAPAGPAAAALPSDLSADPLDRGALLALPSVYRVDVTIEVEALKLADGTRVTLPEAARRIGESGTAVAGAPGGWLVTAAHEARRSPAWPVSTSSPPHGIPITPTRPRRRSGCGAPAPSRSGRG